MKTFNHTFSIKGLRLALLPFCLCSLLGLSSCQDMMETTSDRQVFDPALDQKTDSIYYTLGILKGVQQAIDQYVLVGEMRGDLTATNSYTETDLRELYNFSYDATNKYDSAYVWYRIINNCNYYVAHRDTTLMTGSRYVARSEYAQALSIRAWAYMQLAKTYGTVPFFTTPVTSISEAEAASTGEKKDLRGIVDALAPELEKFSGTVVPTYGSSIDAGKTNAGTQKRVNTANTMFPVDVVLGDMYLETNQYEKAAQSYWKYIRNNYLRARPYQCTPSRFYTYPNNLVYPADMPYFSGYLAWIGIFSVSTPSDIVTYVPMAVNSLRGTTTNLPKLFGWDYYTTDVDTTAINTGTAQYNASTQYVLERQIDPSQAYINLANRQYFYYHPDGANARTVAEVALGDMRRQSTINSVTKSDSTFYLMTKYEGGNINIYRGATIYLRLAEALNRMGYPDAAFAILKDGIGSEQLSSAVYEADTLGNYISGYMRDTTYTLLQTSIPFLSSAYDSYFTRSSSSTTTTFTANYGIHARGSGLAVEGQYSGYQYATEIMRKRLQLGNIVSGESVDSTFLFGPAAIDAVEDLICDEYALELAFEGNRFGDLMRIARHKNAAEFGGANYGGQWLANKLAFKNPVVDLTQERNWYMPFK